MRALSTPSRQLLSDAKHLLHKISRFVIIHQTLQAGEAVDGLTSKEIPENKGNAVFVHAIKVYREWRYSSNNS
jgi:hypothetical protein